VCFAYSKNPHKRTSGLKTLRLKFGQKSKNRFGLKDENFSYNILKTLAAS